MKFASGLVVGGFVCSSIFAMAPEQRILTFEDRVKAQETIERAYYAHHVAEKRSFDEAVPAAVLQDKVRRYLLESAALESVWRHRIDARALASELDRIVRSTHFPGRLLEVFHALHDDPVLIHECFVRPVLARRLVRNFFDGDRELHALEPGSWDSWWTKTAQGLDAQSVTAADGVEGLSIPAVPQSCDLEPRWANGVLDDPINGSVTHTAVWTGTHMIVWGGIELTYVSSGVSYDPLIDNWTRIADTGAPEARQNHVAVWTGQEMLVWGGQSSNGYLSTGGRYDPVQDRWRSTSTFNAPAGRTGMVSAWTGSEMLVWGGRQGACFGTGGRYDPSSDSWAALPTSGSPGARCNPSGVWTGTELIVWGGSANGAGTALQQSGARYVRASDTWAPMTTVAAPTPRWFHTTVWTGSAMLVWGGKAGTSYLNSGGRYDPAADQWAPMTPVSAPTGRSDHTAVWSGDEMLVWGGGNASTFFASGGRYDPAADTWSPIAAGPAARKLHTAVWTGDRMIVWGGAVIVSGGSIVTPTGGRYDPVSDVWTPTTTGAMSELARGSHSAVWTGNEMIVWGGRWLDQSQPTANQFLKSGARYDPLTDSWRPTSELGAPSGRYDHSAVWTGVEMIVWGGTPSANHVARDGGRYDPSQDTWSSMSSENTPSARVQHTAVWTGTAMIVWGGEVAYGGCSTLRDGGIYAPGTDAWSPLPLAGAPTVGLGHVALWTGSEMLIWGGIDMQYDAASDHCFSTYDLGRRFDPNTGSWSPISTNGAPPPVPYAAAAWTGDSMIVWSGGDPYAVSSGGRYDPGLDQWAVLPTAGAPEPRRYAPAVWTGRQFVVWGGQGSAGSIATGGMYDPATATWSPTPLDQAPTPRREHTAVWDGAGMLVWGGSVVANGGRLVIPRDHDGGPCACAPSEVDALSMQPDRITLVWSLPTADSGAPTTYQVLRGTTSALPVGTGANEVCWSTGSATPIATDETVPASSVAFFYLVRGKNACGIGTYGTQSNGSPRTTITCP